MINKECLQCKETFEAKRSSAKFCSDNCKLKYNRRAAPVSASTTKPTSPPQLKGDVPISPPPVIPKGILDDIKEPKPPKRLRERKPVYKATAAKQFYQPPPPMEAARRLRTIYGKQLPGEK